jgi:triosephosphate isomerase (TIM)
MRKTFIAGNWKMNMLRAQAGELARGIVGRVESFAEKTDIMLAPPFTALDVVGQVLLGTGIKLGAQDVFWEEKGAFTGEISPGMLADSGCSWVIIGHSERRHILNETDEMVRKKIGAALERELNVIVCVGETLEEKEQGNTIKAVDGQVERALAGLVIDDPAGLVIAYEPVWAIGTGHHATPSEAEFVHGVIRELAGNIFGDIASRMRILYGGSVNEDNIGEFLQEPNIDGALVGGASLRVESMAGIIEKAGE